MTTLEEAIRQRRSLRRYTGAPVPPDIIEELLEAAIWAPSAHNRQPWRFAVVQGDGQRTLALAMGARLRADLERDAAPPDVIEADTARSYERLTSAAALVVLALTMRDMDSYPDPLRQQHEHTMAVQSVAMAGQNLLLMAHARGLGACWMCAPLFCPEVVRQALALPEDWEPQGLVTLGFPAQTRERTRHPLEGRVIWR